METYTKVIVPKREPKHTPAGQRKRVIQLKALLFVTLWDYFKNKTPKQIKEEFDEQAEFAVSKSGIERTEHSNKFIEDALGQLKDDMFLKEKRVWLFRTLEKAGFDLMFGKDETLAIKLTDIIKNNKKITSGEYIKSILSHAHLAFYAIGRERKWNEQEIITPEFGHDKPIVNAGNPVTESVRNDVKQEFETLGRVHKYKANIQTEDGEKVVNLEKHGLPASVAVIYYVIINMIHKLLDGVKRLNDTKRMVNTAHLILLWIITLHEGARPGDTMKGTHHTDFVFRFGKEYNLLTLAFVSAPTLSYLLNSNHLKRFRFESFKGKRMMQYKGRWHCWFPWEYNSIDLSFIYVLVMRIIAFVDPSTIKHLVFSKKTTNLWDISNNMNESLGIKGLVMYSIRYALCEESIKYAAMIPGQWVKHVMGHAKQSFMRHRYANNLNQRVSIDNIMTVLGADVSSSVTDDVIPIGFHPYDDNRMDDILPGTPRHIIDELDAIQKDINMWLQGSLPSIDKMDSLMARVPKTHNELFADLSNLPFGTHFGFKAGVLTTTMEEKLNDVINNLQQNFFCKKEIPSTTDKVVIWSYGQVMFGEWHKSNSVQAQRDYESMQARQLIAELQQAIMKIDCGVIPQGVTQNLGKKRKVVDEQLKTKSAKKPKVQNDTPPANLNNKDTLFVGYKARCIEVNDVVVVLCSSRDRWSIKVPNTKDCVWICHVTSVIIPESKRARVQVCGNFYTGELSELTYDKESNQEIKVRDDDVVYILSGLSQDDHMHFQLADDEVVEVMKFWQ